MENGIQWWENGQDKRQNTEELVPPHLYNIHAKQAQSHLKLIKDKKETSVDNYMATAPPNSVPCTLNEF